jgi:hypothetical protein
VELERKYSTAASLDEVLAAASERLPRAEIFWLLRAKERWLAGEIDEAREVLTDAFAANPDSEQVWLAAAKLEWETGEVSNPENKVIIVHVSSTWSLTFSFLLVIRSNAPECYCSVPESAHQQHEFL